jgi:two-component system, cell cycle response regulator
LNKTGDMMNKNKIESPLFALEEELLQNGKKILDDFKEFTEGYRKLLKQNQKLIKISDRQGKILKNSNEELEQLNIEMGKANIQLKLMSTTDSLTGVYNKEKLFEYLKDLKKLIDNSIETKFKNFNVLFCDLDNFKNYNDTYGHDTGDFVLKLFIDILKKTIRDSDFLARFGGDEFIIILPNITHERTVIVVEKIEEMVRKKKGFETEISQKLGKEVKILPKKKLSCSIGIFEYTKGMYFSCVEDILSKADKALYKAKNEGKDRYFFWNDSLL